MAPRVDIAKPTSRGFIERPPEKWKGGCWDFGSEMGVLWKIAQRLVKVAMCPAMMKCANIVQRTFQVQIRRKDRRALDLGVLLEEYSGKLTSVTIDSGELGSSESIVV